jgi:ketosteroid isomerase-like protein
MERESTWQTARTRGVMTSESMPKRISISASTRSCSISPTGAEDRAVRTSRWSGPRFAGGEMASSSTQALCQQGGRARRPGHLGRGARADRSLILPAAGACRGDERQCSRRPPREFESLSLWTSSQGSTLAPPLSECGRSGSFVDDVTETDIELARRAALSWDLSSPLDPDLFADDFVFQPSVTGSETAGRRQYVGQSGWRNYQDAAREAWSSITPELHQPRSLGPGVVPTEGELRAVGRSSGAAVTMRFFGVGRIRDGRIVELRIYQTLEEALNFAATTPELSADNPPTAA